MSNIPPEDEGQGTLFDAGGLTARPKQEDQFKTDTAAVRALTTAFASLRVQLEGINSAFKGIGTSSGQARLALGNAAGSHPASGTTAATAAGAGQTWGKLPGGGGANWTTAAGGISVPATAWQQIASSARGAGATSPAGSGDRGSGGSGGGGGGGGGQHAVRQFAEVGIAWGIMSRIGASVNSRMDMFGQASGQRASLGAMYGQSPGMFSGFSSGYRYPGTMQQAIQLTGMQSSMGLTPGSPGGAVFAGSTNALQAQSGFGQTAAQSGGVYASLIGSVQTQRSFRAYGATTWNQGKPLSSTQIFQQVLSVIKRANGGQDLTPRQIATGRQPGSPIDQWLEALNVSDPAQKDAFFQYALQNATLQKIAPGQTYNPENPAQQKLLGLSNPLAKHQRALDSAQGSRDNTFYNDQQDMLRRTVDLQRTMADSLKNIEHALVGAVAMTGLSSALFGRTGNPANFLETVANMNLATSVLGRGKGAKGAAGAAEAAAGAGTDRVPSAVTESLASAAGGALGGGGAGTLASLATKVKGALMPAMIGAAVGAPLGAAATGSNFGGMIGGVGGAATLALGLSNPAGWVALGTTATALAVTRGIHEQAQHNEAVDKSRDFWYNLIKTKPDFANDAKAAAAEILNIAKDGDKLKKGNWDALNSGQQRTVAVLMEVAKELDAATDGHYHEAHKVAQSSNKDMTAVMKALWADIKYGTADNHRENQQFIKQVSTSITEWEGPEGQKRTDDLTKQAAQFHSANDALSQYGIGGYGDDLGTGDPPDAVQTSRMNPELRGRLNKMMAANPNLRLNSGWRGTAEQANLYKGRNGVGASMPGNSMHEKGLAADMGPPSQYRWLQKNASRFGLQTAGQFGEPHHVQLMGTLGDPLSGIGSSLQTTSSDLTSLSHDRLMAALQYSEYASSASGLTSATAADGTGIVGAQSPTTLSGVGAGDYKAATGADTSTKGAATSKEVADALYAAGFRGQDLAVMLAISNRESGFNASAVGDKATAGSPTYGGKDKWGVSFGAFQIRTVQGETGTGGDRDITLLQQGLGAQAKAAYDLWSSGGKSFSPWYVTPSGAVDAAHQGGKIDYSLKYLDQANALVAHGGYGDPPGYAQMGARLTGGRSGGGSFGPINITVNVQSASEAEARRFARSAADQLQANLVSAGSRER